MITLVNYSAVVVSISGGKDSQTCCQFIDSLVREQQYAGQVAYVHCDTGGEWKETIPHCRYLAEAYKVPLQIAVPARLLPDHIERRCRMLQAAGKKGGWPSPALRYCTSDCKRNPIYKVLRALYPGKVPNNVLMVTGERREESSHRAKLSEFADVKPLCGSGRMIVNWRPILDYTVGDVWATIAASGLRRHIAYDLGSTRLGCALCVLASNSDLRIGAKHNPELRDRYLEIERSTGHTFRHKKSLAEILKEDS